MFWQLKSLCFLLMVRSGLAATDPVQFAKTILKDNNITLASAVVPPLTTAPDICSTVWSIDGWVCKASETIKFAERDGAKLLEGERDFNAIASKLHDLNNYFTSNVPSYNGSLPQKTIGLIANLEGLAFMQERANMCWSLMGRLRNSSLCFTCSAVNYKYYLSGRGLTPIQYCGWVTFSCQFHFAHFQRIFGYVMELGKFVSDLSGYPNLFTSAEKQKELNVALKYLNDLLSGIKGSNVQKAIACEYLIKLNTEPILFSFLKIIQNRVSTIRDFITMSTDARTLYSSGKIVRDLPRFLKTSNWQSRMLNLETDLLTKDVSVTDFEPNGNLYLVASLSSASTSSLPSDAVPMNLSMVFP